MSTRNPWSLQIVSPPTQRQLKSMAWKGVRKVKRRSADAKFAMYHIDRRKPISVQVSITCHQYMLFAGLKVRTVKNCYRALDTLQRDTRGFNAAFSHWIPSVSVVQFTVQMSKLNGLGKTHRERIFVVELKLKLRSLFHCEQIAWENSGIKWMKVPSFSLTVTKYLTF